MARGKCGMVFDGGERVEVRIVVTPNERFLIHLNGDSTWRYLLMIINTVLFAFSKPLHSVTHGISITKDGAFRYAGPASSRKIDNGSFSSK